MAYGYLHLCIFMAILCQTILFKLRVNDVAKIKIKIFKKKYVILGEGRDLSLWNFGL
jgi:hypothetical protein